MRRLHLDPLHFELLQLVSSLFAFCCVRLLFDLHGHCPQSDGCYVPAVTWTCAGSALLASCALASTGIKLLHLREQLTQESLVLASEVDQLCASTGCWFGVGDRSLIQQQQQQAMLSLVLRIVDAPSHLSVKHLLEDDQGRIFSALSLIKTCKRACRGQHLRLFGRC